MATNQQFLVYFLCIVICAQLIEANVLFRFSINFNIGKANSTLHFEVPENKDASTIRDSDTSSKELFKNIQNSEHTTSAPIILALQSSAERLIEAENWQKTINERLRSTQAAVMELNKDLLPLATLNSDIANVVKDTQKYVIDVDAVLNSNGGGAATNMIDKMKLLTDFVNLVHPWKVSNQDNDGYFVKEYAEYINVLAKHQFLKKQKEVFEENAKALEAWTQFEQSKVVEV